MKHIFIAVLLCLFTTYSCDGGNSNNKQPEKTFVKISSSSVTQCVDYTGRGNDNEVLLRISLISSSGESAPLKNLVMSMEGTTDIADVEAVKLYAVPTEDGFDPRNPTFIATLLGKTVPTSGEINIPLTGEVKSGTTFYILACQVKEGAKEGNRIDAKVISISTTQETHNFKMGGPEGAREILLKKVLVLAPGDHNSTNYRIPAICTASDGSLVVITDKRKFNNGDLPSDIDVIANRSTDGGKTWSAPVTIAQGQGVKKGYGDAVIVKAKSGKLITVFAGANGLAASTSTDLIRTYMSTSSDNGKSWTPVRDITDQLYGAGCSDPIRSKWNGSFCGSGHGLCMRDGRIMVVGAVKEPNMSGLQNYAFYSDDEGVNWKVSNRAIEGGDEAKVVELNNGDILMSSRTRGNRLWAKSSDRGVNWGAKNSWTEIWGNACDADIVRYTSVKDGFDKNRLLHTLPNNEARQNVTMWISYDEGTTWPIKKTICPGLGMYSSITILPDGTIGVYLEEQDKSGGAYECKMYFLNFSLSWLTNGSDKYIK